MAGKASSLKALHQQALEDFKLVDDTERDQRARQLEDLKFDSGDHWPADIVAMREGSGDPQSSAYIPPRPMITIRSLDQPLNQIVNQARNARFAAKIAPKADAEQKTADVIQGLMRTIEYESHAQTAYIWAFQQAVICGRGYFRINKAWTHDDPDDLSEDPSAWDQDIRIEMILNGFSVYMDPWAQAVNDPKAAEWCFITEDVPAERYKRDYPKTALSGYNESELTSLGDYKDQWVQTTTDGQKSYRIAERYFTVYEDREEVHPTDPDRKRTVRKRRVMWGKMNGVEWIDEPQEWDGKYIPIIPVIGVEKNVGGKRLWEGAVRPNLGPCRMINYLVSADAENMGTVTKTPWVGAAGQFEGFEDKWKTGNTRIQPYQEYNAVTDATGSNILPPPQRNIPTVPTSSEPIGMYVNFVRSTTGVPDAALGHVNANDKSGKAIAALQQASEQGTSNFPDHLQRAIQHSDLVILDLIPEIYDREQRIVQILTGQVDTRSSVMLNAPFYRQEGQPTAIQPGQQPPPQPATQQGLPPVQPPVEHFDLKKGKFAVVVEIGKSFATRREAAKDGLSSLAQAAPELVPRFADKWVESMDFPEADAIAERLKPPGTDDGSLPPQIQAAIGQMQAENQQLKQMLQTKQLENQTKLQEAQMETASREKIAMINASAQLAAVGAKIDAENARTFVDAFEQRIGKALELHMQHVQATMDRIHETHTQARDHAHNVGMAQIGHSQALEQGQQAHEQGTDMAVTQAALTPVPAEAGA